VLAESFVSTRWRWKDQSRREGNELGGQPLGAMVLPELEPGITRLRARIGKMRLQHRKRKGIWLKARDGAKRDLRLKPPRFFN